TLSLRGSYRPGFFGAGGDLYLVVPLFSIHDTFTMTIYRLVDGHFEVHKELPSRSSYGKRLSRGTDSGSKRRSRDTDSGSKRRSRGTDSGSKRRSRDTDSGSKRRSRGTDSGSKRRSRDTDSGSKRRSRGTHCAQSTEIADENVLSESIENIT
ncbi:hypothetical protein LSAT2_032468, partial [Lamellibrachia satsuma]